MPQDDGDTIVEIKQISKDEAKKEELKEIDMVEHQLEVPELLKRFNVDPKKGLAAEDAAERLLKDGFNQLSPPKTKPEWLKFLLQMTDFFSLLLWAGSIFSFIGYAIDTSTMDNLYVGVVLAVVVLTTAIFSYFQERKSSNVLASFKNFLPPQATVIRDGKTARIEAKNIVVGDIVVVNAGDKIPADLRLISTKDMKVDNSSLTGESEAQSRNAAISKEQRPYEAKNIAFYGSLVTEGQGTGIVIFTGDNTVIGQIAGLASGTSAKQTPIHKEISRFIYIISAFAITIGVIFFFMGFLVGRTWIQSLVFMIGIIVANVPEGLLVTVTVSLTLTAQRMAKKKVLVKNLEGVETLGSTTVICSDKTGTLTMNVMTVSHVWYDMEIHSCPTSTQKGDFKRKAESFKSLQRIATLCNRATFQPDDMHKPAADRKCIGDASESALIKFCDPLRSIDEFRKQNTKVFEVPFNSTNKFQVSVHKQEGKADSRLVVVMKGAPERVIARCSKILVNGKEGELTKKAMKTFSKAYETLGGMGERVLGFCHAYLPEKYSDKYDFAEKDGKFNFPMEDMTFVGLIALIDPPRPTVPDAVKKCQTAGIKIIMVTGDHPITAKAIAKQVGIIRSDTIEDIAMKEGVDPKSVDPRRAKAIVLHGGELVGFTPADWDRVLSHPQIVFARTSPQQKLVIVENNQRRKEIVAVTGDGVNDSPALKKANIGVAMGITGSDVSKEAADMILLDDNFASIVNGVEEGRLIFDNLKKSIAYTLSGNVPEIFPFLLLIALDMPLALSTLLILCIDLGTDMTPAISLAYETAESDIMSRPPRNAKTESLVTNRLLGYSYLSIGVMQMLGGIFTFLVVLGDFGFHPARLLGQGLAWDDEDVLIFGEGWLKRQEALYYGQTSYFVSIVIVQIADVIICKTRKLSVFQQKINYFMCFGIFTELALSCIIIYVPYLNLVLGTRPIQFVHWLPAVPFAIFIFVYDEVRKMMMRRSPGGFLEQRTYY